MMARTILYLLLTLCCVAGVYANVKWMSLPGHDHPLWILLHLFIGGGVTLLAFQFAVRIRR